MIGYDPLMKTVDVGDIILGPTARRVARFFNGLEPNDILRMVIARCDRDGKPSDPKSSPHYSWKLDTTDDHDITLIRESDGKASMEMECVGQIRVIGDKLYITGVSKDTVRTIGFPIVEEPTGFAAFRRD